MAINTTIDEIQQAIDQMPAALVAKGKVSPEVTILVRANVHIAIMLSWKKPFSQNSWDTESEYFNGETADDVIQKASGFIAGLPSAEQAKLHQFMGELGRVIDGGRDAGIAVDFMNPLLDTMKRISENVITHQPAKES